MLCEDFMKKDVECISETDNAQIAAQKMRDRNVGFLPVCDAQKHVVGIVTDRDLALRLIADNKPVQTSVKDFMSADVVFCRADADINTCEDLMSKHHKSRIVCLDQNDCLQGVISLSDIAQHDTANAPRLMQEVSMREATTH